MDTIKTMTPEKLTILLADDSRVILKAFSRIMDEFYNLIEVSDGQSAWEEIEACEDICAVFSDWEMPRMTGVELAAKIRDSKNPRIKSLPIIMVTSKNEDDVTKQQAFDAGVTDFVSKPFDRAELLARAKAHVKPLANVGTPAEEEGKAVLDTNSRIGNMEYFQQQAIQMLSFSSRHGVPVGFALIGIDKLTELSSVNNLTDSQESEFIMTVGGYIAEALRKDDSIAHLSKSVFGVLLSSADLETTAQFAQRVQESISKAKFNLNGKTINITVSAGLDCSSPLELKNLPALFKTSRERLLNAMRSGNDIQPKVEQGDGLKRLVSLDKALVSVIDQNTGDIDWRFTLNRMMPLLQFLDEKIGTDMSNSASSHIQPLESE